MGSVDGQSVMPLEVLDSFVVVGVLEDQFPGGATGDGRIELSEGWA